MGAGKITMTKKEFEDALERAAERGANKAMEKIGLHDENAGDDVRDLRDLIKGWRDVKKTAVQTVVRTATVFLLGAMAVGIALAAKAKELF